MLALTAAPTDPTHHHRPPSAPSRGDRGGGQGELSGHEGRPVSISGLGRGTDAHGRLPAHVFEERSFLAEEGGQSVQKVLEGAIRTYIYIYSI